MLRMTNLSFFNFQKAGYNRQNFMGQCPELKTRTNGGRNRLSQ